MNKNYLTIFTKNKFAPVLEFQEEVKRLGGKILEKHDVYKALTNSQFDHNEVKITLLNLVFDNYADQMKENLYILKKVYYIKSYTTNPHDYFWQIATDRPSESLFENGDVNYKISLKDNQLITILNPANSVLIERQNGDLVVIFNSNYSNIAQLINNSNLLTPYKTIMNKFNMKKPTPTFWICASIIFVGLLLCGTYYLVNKDNGRYQIVGYDVVDKKTGEAKPIKFLE